MTEPGCMHSTPHGVAAESAHVLLTDGSACRVSFDFRSGIAVAKEGQPIGELSFADLSSLVGHSEYPAANVAQKIACMLEPGEITREHRDSLVISIREWILEAHVIAGRHVQRVPA